MPKAAENAILTYLRPFVFIRGSISYSEERHHVRAPSKIPGRKRAKTMNFEFSDDINRR
jgi:hypothetical protein